MAFSAGWPSRWESRESGEWVSTQIDWAEPLLTSEQIPYPFFVVHDNVQVNTGDRDVGVSRGGADLGQGATAGQRMADERVAAVMNR